MDKQPDSDLCPMCRGVGHLGPAVAGTSQRDYGRECPECQGTGRRKK